MLTPTASMGCFHRNKGRTVHTLIEGRGRYVLIHADEDGEEGKKRVESFVVGRDVSAGERAVWIVEGGKYKASFLLEGEGRLLISEVCGLFEFRWWLRLEYADKMDADGCAGIRICGSRFFGGGGV